jgi:hypothetical protein
MKPLLRLCCLALTLLAGHAHAYSSGELRGDCEAAEHMLTGLASDPYQTLRGTRCLAYVSGVVDGYGIGSYLADKVGVGLNAFCLPADDGDLSLRLVRAVLAQLDHQLPDSSAPTGGVTAAALAKAFPCDSK